MNNIPAAVTPIVLDIVRSHFPNETPQVIQIIERFLANFDANNWVVDRYEIEPTEDGAIASIVIQSGASDLTIDFPLIPYVELFFTGNSTNEFVIQLLLEEDATGTPFIEIQDLTIGIRIKDFLAGVGGAVQASVSYTDSYRLYPNLSTSLNKFLDVSFPDLALGESGLKFSAKGLEFDLLSTTSIPPIEAMGLTPAFIGLYLRQMSIEFDPQNFFTGFPSFALDFNDLALGTTGISFQFFHLFDVGACLDGTDSGGFLLTEDFKFCTEILELKVLDNQIDDLRLRGVIQLPFFEAQFAFDFTLDKDTSSGDLGIKFELTYEGAEPISLGAPDWPFDFPARKVSIKGGGTKVDNADPNTNPGLPAGWEGFVLDDISIEAPDLSDLPVGVRNARIGEDGFSGELFGDFDLNTNEEGDAKLRGDLVVELAGLELGIRSFVVNFEANLPTSGTEIKGLLALPVFAEPVGITIEVDANGDFTFEVDGFDEFYFSDDCIALKWVTDDVNGVINSLAPSFFNNFSGANVEVTTRIILGEEGGVQEIRTDFAFDQQKQTFDIPGLRFTTPDTFTLNLLLQNDSNNGVLPTNATVAVSLQSGQEITGESNFAWLRSEERELQNDDKRSEDQPPLLKLDVTTNEKVSLALASFKVNEAKLPTFFQEYQSALPVLDFADKDSLCTPINIAKQSLDTANWSIDFDLNLEDQDFRLPFLKDDNERKTTGIRQFVDVKKGEGGAQLQEGEPSVKCPLDLIFKVGNLRFETSFALGFNWEKFAFKVEHDGGIKLYSPQATLEPKSFLGMEWRFKGAKEDLGEDGVRYHYFTLVTKDFNYQIQQAEGSVLELDFTKASKEPISFGVSNFALSAKGVSLTAEVLDRPARLNGVDTRFRFIGTRFEIVDNSIRDFTLSGSGPLPPDLVGDAMVDVSLQFSQRDGDLTLVAGGAQLRGSKLLDAKSTRFQFQIDAIGLEFVNDGKFHLYFILTGSARFKLAPGDDAEGPLALLPNIQIDFVECPLTGDMSVIAQHIQFLIELPKPISFSFLGCFEMELRGFGFIPQADPFNGDASMLLSGQVLFSTGGFDTKSARMDFHGLYIGVPAKGKFFPRINLERLALEIKFGSAFRLSGVVSFLDNDSIRGFMGEGVVEIQGLPTMAATFSFVRVRRDSASAWVRAWFIYLEVRKVSFQIPVINLFLREVGLGFGYRYTITSIKAADETNDVRELLKRLKDLAKTQGNLSKLDSWAVDLEERGEDPRWTIVFRAMISQTSASSLLKYNTSAETGLPCTFLFDAIIAFRSDLTFFMSVRVWLNTNYNDFVLGENRVRERPLMTGFVLLSPRQKRFLANISSNSDGLVGKHPPFPNFIEQAIENSSFSITLLIEPGLFHYEMGWPNMLRWKANIELLEVDIRGGFIFRVSKNEMVIGQSFMARGTLEIESGIDLGIVGVRVFAFAQVAYGARYIGVLAFKNTSSDSAFYGAIGVEIQVRFSVNFWIKIKLGFVKIKISVTFSLNIGFTAGLEVGLDGFAAPGLRGRGTISVGAMGKSVRLNIKLGVNEGAVNNAKAKTDRFLNVGLEATDVEAVPGTTGANERSGGALARSTSPELRALAPQFSGVIAGLKVPGYSIFMLPDETEEGAVYFVLFPRGEDLENDCEERGFLPPPPRVAADEDYQTDRDFSIRIPNTGQDYALEKYNPLLNTFEPITGDSHEWQINWNQTIIDDADLEFFDEAGTEDPDLPSTADPGEIPRRLGDYLRSAFVIQTDGDGVEQFSDPEVLPESVSTFEDSRVQNPSDSAFESAVRGAIEQFEGSPFFKKDPNNEYEQLLSQAYDDHTDIYAGDESLETPAEEVDQARLQQEQADQFRGYLVQSMVSELKDYVAKLQENEDPDPVTATSIAFQTGLVFKVSGADFPTWLEAQENDADLIQISQRQSVDDPSTLGTDQVARTFNIKEANFAINTPQFEKVKHYTDANTIAITWDLEWSEPPHPNCTKCQADPDHHLAHYQVRRRTLDNSEPELLYTVKNANTLLVDRTYLLSEDAINELRALDNGANGLASIADALESIRSRQYDNRHLLVEGLKEVLSVQEIDQSIFYIEKLTAQNETKVLKQLKPRFKIVDHFNQEALEDQANLPASGRSYLYTVTPIDFAGNLGRPLNLVATRFPNLPPQVPLDAELEITYKIDDVELLAPGSASSPSNPDLLGVDSIRVNWTEPRGYKEGPNVPAAKYNLVFRKEAVLPVGSFGLDGSTQGPRNKKLPTSNARPLPSDIKIPLSNIDRTEERVQADVAVDDLIRLKILPDGKWKPEAWTVFIQTESVNKVPSPLVPVNLLLRMTGNGTSTPTSDEDNQDKTDALLRREERRPAHIEWLPLPIRYELLPPEDQLATTGTAHFPMVEGSNPDDFKFGGNLNSLAHQLHPLGIRVIRFRWNQGPSSQSDYPLGLNAGFDILQLDVDSYSTEVFEDQEQLSRAITEIQEVQLVPAEDLYLIPGDTLTTSQWEAWYPSRRLRLRSANSNRVEGSETPFGPWYSWRDSVLVWPDLQGFAPGTQAPNEELQVIHPFLQGILDTIEGDGLIYTVDRQIPPPIQAVDEKQLLEVTPIKPDPYGWGVLQRFGLSTTFSIRRKDDGRLVTADQAEAPTLLDLLQQSLPTAGGADDALLKHLHVELLFQQGKSVELEETATQSSSLLGIVQLSLRPIPEQQYVYQQVDLKGPAGSTVELILVVNTDTNCTIIDQANPGLGETQLTAEEDSTIISTQITMSLDGQNRLLIRCKSKVPGLRFKFPLTYLPMEPSDGEPTEEEQEPLTLDELSPDLRKEMELDNTNEERPIITLYAGFYDAARVDDFVEELRTWMDGKRLDYQELFDFRLTANERFEPTDERSTYFTIPADALMADTSEGPSIEQDEWLRFKQYAELFNSVEAEDPKVDIPIAGDSFESYLIDYLEWSQRFMDHAPPMSLNEEGRAKVDVGPWIATAYPRASTPTYATPDRSGRIKYDHLLEDKWAHNFRHYIRPFGRYDLLWESLRQSPELFPNTDQSFQLLKKTTPDPAQDVGGLDVVLHRTQPVQKPVILNSARLDGDKVVGSPREPGRTWEVIIAQHPEQNLMERNQTLFRQLSFRQIVFALLRRFSQQNLREDLVELVSYHNSDSGIVVEDLPIERVEAIYPDIPTDPSMQLEHIDLAILTEDEKESLSLPKRMQGFSQNSMVLQWEALPFFYEQKLLLAAQTANTVSPVNAVIQRDFHYQTPSPRAILYTRRDETGKLPNILIPLQRLWDSLSPQAQLQWQAEEPAAIDSQERSRKWSSLPDLEVVYQLVELFTGNLEVQTEYTYEEFQSEEGPVQKRFIQRQLAKRLLTDLETVLAPRWTEKPQDYFYLSILFSPEPIIISVARDYGDISLPAGVTYNGDNRTLQLAMPLTDEQIADVLISLVPELVSLSANDPEFSFEQWYTTRSITGAINLEQLSPSLAAKLEFVDIPLASQLPPSVLGQLAFDGGVLRWQGPIRADQRADLRAYADDSSLPMHQIVGNLLNAFDGNDEKDSSFEVLTTWRASEVDGFTATIAYVEEEIEGVMVQVARWTLAWQQATISETQAELLRSLTDDAIILASIERLILQVQESTQSVVIEMGEPTIQPAAAPLGFTISVSDETGEPMRILSWTGPISEEEEGLLLNLPGDEAFATGITSLIQQVKDFYNGIGQGVSFLEEVSPGWPIVDKNRLVFYSGYGNDQLNVVYDDNLSQVKVSLSLGDLTYLTDLRQLKARFRAVVNPEDPLLAALEDVLNQVFEIVTQVPYAQRLRIRKPLSSLELTELEANSASGDRDTIGRLYDDLQDRSAFQLAQTPYCVQERLSILPENPALPAGFSTPRPTNNELILRGLDTTGLQELTGDEDFIQAIETLIREFDENDNRVFNATGISVPISLKLSQIPEALLASENLVFSPMDPVQFVEEVSWYGPMSAATAEVLTGMQTEPSLQIALQSLVDEAQQVVSRVSLPLSPEEIPSELVTKLSFEKNAENDQYTKINWSGILLGQERQLLEDWNVSEGLRQKIEALLAFLDATTLSEPVAPLIPDLLADQLLIEANQVIWLGVASIEQLEALNNLKESSLVSTKLGNLLGLLLIEIEAKQDDSAKVVLSTTPILIRPTTDAIPSYLPDNFSWNGETIELSPIFVDEEDWQTLARFDTPDDLAFNNALDNIRSALEELEWSEAFTEAVRPSQSDLSPALQERFLIGKVVLEYCGYMSQDEVLDLYRSEALSEAGRLSIQRLYGASQRKLIKDRDIRIMARRAAAKPSEMIPFVHPKLSEE